MKVYSIYKAGIDNLLYIANIKDCRDGNPQGTSYIGLEHIPIIITKQKCLLISIVILFILFYWLLLLFWFVKSICSLITEKRANNFGKKIVLGTSSAILRVIKNAGIYDENLSFLYGPWIKQPKSIANVALSVFNVINLIDILKSTLVSVSIFYHLVFKFGMKIVPEVIGVYKWTLYYYALKKISKETDVIFCNHMDPYAILIDRVAKGKKLLIQHGTLIIMYKPQNVPLTYYKFIKEENVWTLNPPNKLKNISFVYTFTDKEYQVLSASILEKEVSYISVGYGLKLSDYIGNKSFSVLIIGYYPFYSKLEESVIKLLQDDQIDVFIKNHPTVDVAAYRDFKNKYNFTIIEGNQYPKVDIVISYDSTLALEYKSVGVEVLYYSEFEINNINSIVKNIKK